MTELQNAKRWVESNRDLWLDMLRVYLGVGLIVKGVQFVGHASTLMTTMDRVNLTWGTGMIGHYVILAHIFGGFLLAIGLLTRGAALANVPVLLGAVVFVHAREGLFTQAQTLEFAILVLVLLVLFAVNGSGRLSVDHYVAAHVVSDPPADPQAGVQKEPELELRSRKLLS